MQDLEVMLARAKRVKFISDAHRVEGTFTWMEQVPVRAAMSKEKLNSHVADFLFLKITRRSSSFSAGKLNSHTTSPPSTAT